MLKTFPDQKILEFARNRTPEYMGKNDVPWAVYFEGLLTDDQCAQIIHRGLDLPTYKFGDCGAYTKEFDRPLPMVMAPIHTFGRASNEFYFKFDLFEESPAAWLQTYGVGGDYREHMDGAPGASRKLTAVCLLSPEDSYSGGDLSFNVTGQNLVLPRTRGTVVVFQPWVLHEVSQVTYGTRQTINMGFFGPPFK